MTEFLKKIILNHKMFHLIYLVHDHISNDMWSFFVQKGEDMVVLKVGIGISLFLALVAAVGELATAAALKRAEKYMSEWLE